MIAPSTSSHSGWSGRKHFGRALSIPLLFLVMMMGRSAWPAPSTFPGMWWAMSARLW